MSPFLTCFPRLLSAKPFGWGHTRLSHIKRRRLIMPLVALVQKIRAHPQLRTLLWCSALPSSSPLLLAFRLRTSECLYKNTLNQFHPKHIRHKTRRQMRDVFCVCLHFAFFLHSPKNVIFGCMARKPMRLRPTRTWCT